MSYSCYFRCDCLSSGLIFLICKKCFKIKKKHGVKGVADVCTCALTLSRRLLTHEVMAHRRLDCALDLSLRRAAPRGLTPRDHALRSRALRVWREPTPHETDQQQRTCTR